MSKKDRHPLCCKQTYSLSHASTQTGTRTSNPPGEQRKEREVEQRVTGQNTHRVIDGLKY